MKPTAIFLDLIRRISSENAAYMLGDLAMHLVADKILGSQHAAVVRHLRALGFRLEGNGKFEAAARVYGLATALTSQDRQSFQAVAFEARLHDLVVRELWEETSRLIIEVKQNNEINSVIRNGVAALLRLGWNYECRYAVEPAVQCYSLAFELSGSDSDFLTGDGNRISTKIRNLRVLQMTELAEAGQHEKAAELHERTRSITGLGPVCIYDIVSARSATAEDQGIYQEVLPSRKIVEPCVRFFGGPLKLASTPGSLDAPPQYVAFFEDCLTFPRSNVVLHRNRLIYDLAAHPMSSVAEIRDGINPDQIMLAAYGAGRALVEMPDHAQKSDAGLMLFGFQSRNYGHWILEFVPRMLCFNDPACPPEFPIFIDDHMPVSHRQIIELLDERNRTVIPLAAVPTRFQKLGLAPVPAFFPFDTRPEAQKYDTIWPKDILEAVSHKLLEKLGLAGPNSQSRLAGRKIMLSRKGYSQRQLLNEGEIIDVLRLEGFEVVHPELLSFSEQVNVFRSADLIVGSASSALTNCIFCRPGARIIALIHEDLSFNFRGYTSMIESSGAKLMFLRGRTVPGEAVHPYHVNYLVDPRTVISALREISRLI